MFMKLKSHKENNIRSHDCLSEEDNGCTYSSSEEGIPLMCMEEILYLEVRVEGKLDLGCELISSPNMKEKEDDLDEEIYFKRKLIYSLEEIHNIT